MRVICNEYKIGNEKLLIEHDIQADNYYFRVVNLNTFVCRHESEAIGHLIPARAKAFEFMGVKTN